MFYPLLISLIRHPLFAVLFASVLAGISGSAQELGPKEIIRTFRRSQPKRLGRRPWLRLFPA